MSLFTTEYDPEVEKRVLIEEAKEEGMAKGMEKERNKIIFNMHTKGLNSKEISSFINADEAVVEKVIGEAMAGK
jgi:predicted transposase YdaD